MIYLNQLTTLLIALSRSLNPHFPTSIPSRLPISQISSFPTSPNSYQNMDYRPTFPHPDSPYPPHPPQHNFSGTISHNNHRNQSNLSLPQSFHHLHDTRCHSCQPSRNGRDSAEILGLVPELPTVPEWAGQSQNFGPCPGDVGDVPDLHAPCAAFRRLPLAYGSSSDLKRAVSVLNCSVSARRLPRVT